MTLLEIIQSWHYPASVIFVGVLVGDLLYRITPAPPEAAAHLDRALRAGLASLAARHVGADLMETLADVVGMQEAMNIQKSLKRQRRRFIFWGMMIALVIVAVVFKYLPFYFFPDWVFVLLGALGAYRLWKIW